MSYGAYQPAHEAHLTKHHNQMYEFDSPATIAKQQQHLQQPMVQAGGAPSTGIFFLKKTIYKISFYFFLYRSSRFFFFPFHFSSIVFLTS